MPTVQSTLLLNQDWRLMVLAAFVLITAIILRSGTYVLFAAWLVVNLRMAALSGGWDAQWLGRSVPQDWLLLVSGVATVLVLRFDRGRVASVVAA